MKNHSTFRNLKNLPILFVEDYKILTKELLKDYMNKIKHDRSLNLDILTDAYWSNFISDSKNVSTFSIEIKEPKYVFKYYLLKRKFLSKLNSYNKKINYYLRKLT